MTKANSSSQSNKLFVNNLPLEIHCEIFQQLRSADRQRLAATCSLFRKTHQNSFRDLPTSIQRKIMSFLSPASRRLLAATCISFYESYKEHFYLDWAGVTMAIGNDEITSTSSNGRVIVGTTAYHKILMKWLNGKYSGNWNLDLFYNLMDAHHAYL